MNFIALSSLPRSGSTVLMYLLNQNPKFVIGPDSDLSYLLNNDRQHMVNSIDRSQIPHQKASECLLNYCRNGAQSWIDTLIDKNQIFIDKSRGWSIDLDFNFKVFPKLKLIINIRDLRGILNSLEKINSSSLFANRRIYYDNIDIDLQRQRLDGVMKYHMFKDVLTCLRELVEIPKQYNSNILITRYEDLIKNPDYFMESLYDFLEIPYYQHNFDKIEQGSEYNDNVYMPYGNHTIKNKLDSSISNNFEYIRPDLLDQIVRGYSWYYKNFYGDMVVSK